MSAPTVNGYTTQDLDRELRQIQEGPSLKQRLSPRARRASRSVGPVWKSIRLGFARIWKNKGLYAGLAAFVTAAAQFGLVAGLITFGVAAIVSDALT